ncbi:MAG: WcbI family polysaccharide biosynthesis putative acetyltransferase [Rhodoblastus sp.]
MLSEIDHQILHVLGRRLLGRDKGAPRIAVVGNCQSFGIAYGMKLLIPQAHIDRFTIVRKGVTTLDRLAKTLGRYDHVFSLEFQPGFVRGGGWEELKALLPDVAPIPSIVFSGFHPDTIYILDPTRGGYPVEGPTGPYHSAIALYAFLRGMSVEQTIALFGEPLFEALGYFDVWQDSAREFLDLAAASDLDLSAELVRWSRSGPFMYSMNHPKAHVLFDVAKALLTRAGLNTAPVEFSDFAVDDIVRGVVFPVYPEIAERYGHRGSYLFKRSNYRLSRNIGQFDDLAAYIAGSFAVYAKHQRAQLMVPRMIDWDANPEVGRLFAFHAADALTRRYAAAQV